MKRLLVLAVLSILLLVPIAAFAQTGTIAGQVTIAENGNPLADVAVYLGDSKTGTYTKQNGQFTLKNVPVGTHTITVSMMGYRKQSKEIEVNVDETTIVKFEMEMESINIEGISVLSDRAESDTPIAYTDVDKEEITSTLGSRDIPLVLTTTPSVYSTGQGGGAGDARINIRGFDQANVAVMINGVPVNDMENGWVYWSNWDGLGDATSSIQVQRGLSAINLAVPSIGGTMNMITDPTQMDKGVRFKQEYGSGGFQKKTLIANSGLVNDKYAFSFNVTRKTGDGVIDATWTDAWSYYLATSYKINDNNRLEFYAAGAPQRHGQNLYKQNMAAYNHDYAEDNSGVPDSELADYFSDFPESDAGMFYNENWNTVDPNYSGKQWWNGDLHDRFSPNFLNERENYYHKPQINLNWFTKLNEKLDVYSIIYYSGGKGGGTGTFGSVNWDYSGPSRVVDWNSTIAENDTLSTGSAGILRNSVNQQWTIGAISRAYYQINENLKSSVGVDWRTAEIDHFREVRDLLGGDYFFFDGNDFDTADEYEKELGDKIDYYNTNKVGWFGGYAQGEYVKDKLKASLMVGLSSVQYQYTDHFVMEGGDELYTETDWIMGYQTKGGASYRISNSFGVYGNAGYINKCPIFDEVINDWTGELIDDPENEKFLSMETGFNFVGLDEMLNINTGLYYTNWIDQSKSFSVDTPNDEIKIFVSGIDSRHIGAEMEVEYQPISLAKFDLSLSKGDWTYLNDLENVVYEDDAGFTDTLNIYVKDLKVGDAPQTQLSFGTTLYPVPGLDINVNYKYFDDFYAAWDPFSRQDPNDDEESWQIPAYGVMDLHISYKLPTIVKGFDVEAYGHIFNLLDDVYVLEAVDNSAYNAWADWGSPPHYPHSGSSAEVFFGLPRTFNAGLSLSF
ncbi:MAG: TonB-dependent receptor [Candidatus Cloacimonetes bacterium]|nr:TonB-dependent receptor [Candidatus Cloacimonadota bacterium]MCF7813957.1 TonB-dependent receptor [Candidatus Cloacimonadota bacterium]MCF7868801.1 TonB-dependent receptor [Candidatus Cloacimonadota bacterium]MCF7884060.1 TonB-dependent receptor [Candidatus Cloacimonadota bacterium]